MGYDRSYVSKIESGNEPATREFATHAETALRAGGALRQAYEEYAAVRPRPKIHRPTVTDPAEHPSSGSLVVDHDDATLTYDDGTYLLTQRRRLVNGSTEPVTRYLIRISVDRYPGDPERSNRLYSRDPLTWDEINLHAWHGIDRTTQPMRWTVHHDRAAVKELWLRCSPTTQAVSPSTPERAAGSATNTLSTRSTGATGFNAPSASPPRRCPCASTINQHCRVYVATDLHPDTSRPPDPEEQDLQPTWLLQADFEDKIRTGHITDGATIAAYALYLLRNQPHQPAPSPG